MTLLLDEILAVGDRRSDTLSHFLPLSKSRYGLRAIRLTGHCRYDGGQSCSTSTGVLQFSSCHSCVARR